MQQIIGTHMSKPPSVQQSTRLPATADVVAVQPAFVPFVTIADKKHCLPPSTQPKNTHWAADAACHTDREKHIPSNFPTDNAVRCRQLQSPQCFHLNSIHHCQQKKSHPPLATTTHLQLSTMCNDNKMARCCSGDTRPAFVMHASLMQQSVQSRNRIR